MSTTYQTLLKHWPRDAQATAALMEPLPRTIAALAPAYRVVHDEPVARLGAREPADLDRQITYADGTPWAVRDLLTRKLLLHAAHHRGQLALLCRLAGGVPIGVYGPTREESAARRTAVAAP